MICSPQGNPSWSNPIGTDNAGNPAEFHAGVCIAANEIAFRSAPLKGVAA
tara:strand:- start:21 stop:170 length:150 start_codon:yes stop_codon:yes gene_type:complete